MTSAENLQDSAAKRGYVYILTNPSFRSDWIKVGRSARPVDIRSKELDNTAVPLPFSIYATIETVKYVQVERLFHKTIDRLTDLRIRRNREFFNVSPEAALEIFRDIATTLDDAVIRLYQDNRVVSEERVGDAHSTSSASPAPSRKTKKESKRTPKPRFRFSMIGLQVGATLSFIPTGVTVQVASDDTILYEGQTYRMTPFVEHFLPDPLRIPSGAYQGPKYFAYQGRRLTDLRLEAERKARRRQSN